MTITKRELEEKQLEANREYFDKSLNEAIRMMERFIEDAKRDAARPDIQMSPTKKVQALHRAFAWGVANANTELSNTADYAAQIVLLTTKLGQ